jgi:two-component system chemotaxis response regulator CheY
VKAIIVDDSRTIRMMLKKFLAAEGFGTLFEAGDGSEALSKLTEVGPVDLVVVDWNMPVMDGLDFVKNLRRDKGFNGVRVVMLTTESEEGKIARAMEAGVNAFMTKPFKADVLRGRLDALGFEKLRA